MNDIQTNDHVAFNTAMERLVRYLDSAEQDRDDKSTLILELKEIIKEQSKITHSLERKTDKLTTHVKMIIKAIEKRDADCKEVQTVFKTELKNIPDPKIEENRDIALKTMETKFDKLLPRIYTAITICTGVGGLVTLVLYAIFKQKIGS